MVSKKHDAIELVSTAMILARKVVMAIAVLMVGSKGVKKRLVTTQVVPAMMVVGRVAASPVVAISMVEIEAVVSLMAAAKGMILSINERDTMPAMSIGAIYALCDIDRLICQFDELGGETALREAAAKLKTVAT